VKTVQPMAGDLLAFGSTVLAGQRGGSKEVDDGIWIVTPIRHDRGYIDLEHGQSQWRAASSN